MVLPNLTTNAYYEVKVRAASISTINPRQVILGSYSEPQKVTLDILYLKSAFLLIQLLIVQFDLS